jgi:hypothetical protein
MVKQALNNKRVRENFFGKAETVNNMIANFFKQRADLYSTE